jgi:hypothetical protein
MPERFIYLLSDVSIVLLMFLYMVLSTVFGHIYSVNDIDHEYSAFTESIGYQNFSFLIESDKTLRHIHTSVAIESDINININI